MTTSSAPADMLDPIWVSLCGSHLQRQTDCDLCQAGSWRERTRQGDWEGVPYFREFITACRRFGNSYGRMELSSGADRGFTFIARIQEAVAEYDRRLKPEKEANEQD